MEVGIGLPSAIPGTGASQILQWARAADDLGFSSVGVIDRLVYGNTEPLTTLAAVAAVTTRVKLMTSILLAPLRQNAALLAKQAATVNHLSGGRLVLGMAVGGYADDYAASAVPFPGRGRMFDDMLPVMSGVWNGEPQGFAGPIGPAAGLARSQLVFGGHGHRAYTRVATWGGGWIAGSRGVEKFREGAEGVLKAWSGARRDGSPRLMAMPYFSLGDRAGEDGHAFLSDHYAVEGDAVASRIAASALTSTREIQDALTAYERAGCDELILFPCSADPGQVRALAGAIG